MSNPTAKPANELNDAPILDQVREHWQRLATLIVWKVTHGKRSITISQQDILEFQKENRLLLTHGHVDSIEFKLITEEEAERIKAHQAQMKGTA